MAYISHARRALVVTQQPPRLGVNEPLNVGELTYQLTVAIEEYRRIHGTKFQTIAEIVGALAQAKDEFRRRVVHPYEDTKLKDNGDCYAVECEDCLHHAEELRVVGAGHRNVGDSTYCLTCGAERRAS